MGWKECVVVVHEKRIAIDDFDGGTNFGPQTHRGRARVVATIVTLNPHIQILLYIYIFIYKAVLKYFFCALFHDQFPMPAISIHIPHRVLFDINIKN